MNKQLESLVSEFDSWRSKRKKRTSTPKELITKTLSLRGHVSDAEIVKRLGINSTALKNWTKQEITQDSPAQFVELPHTPALDKNRASTTNTPNHDNPSTLKVALPSGVSLSLTGSPNALADFVLKLTQKGAL